MEHLAIFNPLNGIFGANFTPWPQKGNLRDLSGQVWGVKIFFRGQGGPGKGWKMVIFDSF